GVSVEVPVEVVPGRPTFALVQPEKVIFSAQNRTPIKFEFLPFDNRGNPRTVTPSEIQWKVIGDIGTIDRTGMFTPASSDEEQHGEVLAFVPKLNLLARSDVTLHGYDSFPKEIRIEPDKIDLIRGTTYRFRATVFDSMGRIVDMPTNWRVFDSNNSEIVDGVTPDGVFVVSKEDSDIDERFRVVASVESSRGVVQGEALATMITGPLNTIEIEPRIMQLKTGETVAFSALGRDAYGNPKEIRPTWQVIGDIGAIQSHPRGSESVTLTAVSEGTVTIIATQGGIVGKAEISVTPKEPAGAELEIAILETSLEDDSSRKFSGSLALGVGQSVDNPFQIQAGHRVSFIARDRITGELLSADWSIISESSIGTISTDGQFSAKRVGAGKIQTSAGNPERTAEFFIRVIPGDLASIQVTPAIASVLTKDTAQFSAQGYDAYGNLVIPNSVRWDVTGGIGTIDDSGIFTPTKIPLRTSIQGSVVASVSDVCFTTPAMNSAIGIYGSASVTVVAELGPLSVISMTADPAIVEAGGVSVISILGADAEGNPIAAADFDAPITFTLTPDIGRITEFRYRAPERLPPESERRVIISAATTVDDKTLTAEVSLTLKPAQLAQVQLQPNSVTLRAGDVQQFHLTAADAFGNATKVTSQWRLSKPLGTLSKLQPDAVTYTAKESGAVELSVVATGTSDTANPIRATASIVVQPDEPTILRIEPSSAVIVSGERREFHVIGIDAYDNEIDELNLDWHIDGDAEVGSLQPVADNSASQIFSAAAVGDISIVAKFQSISVRADVSVIHGELSSLRILLVGKLVSKEEWKIGRMEGWKDERYHQANDSKTSFQLISGGRYIFRAIGQDKHKNEFSPPVQWTLTGDIGKIEANADNSSLVLYQATFVGKGRLLATANRVSAEAALEVAPISKKIGKQGGRLDSPANASLSIPPNALTDETGISISIIHPLITDMHDSSSETLFVDHFDFQPRGLIFKKPAQLSLSYTDAMNKSNPISGEGSNTVDETKLSLYFWDSFQEKWIRAGGKVDIVKKTVTASVNHLAPYTIMESKAEPPAKKNLDISDIKLTPKVFYAPETNRLTIEYNLAVASAEPAYVTINIYD
ncbi:MAG: hypothetical protein ACE5PV_18305, partial [Candidatus Poribacteria bacterium]